MTMLIAGHETTAAVLTWTLHCLADRPDVLTRLQQEVCAPFSPTFLQPCFLVVVRPHSPKTFLAVLPDLWEQSRGTSLAPTQSPGSGMLGMPRSTGGDCCSKRQARSSSGDLSVQVFCAGYASLWPYKGLLCQAL